MWEEHIQQETEQGGDFVKPIPSAAGEQVFALTRRSVFWLVLELFFHILLCFGWKVVKMEAYQLLWTETWW